MTKKPKLWKKSVCFLTIAAILIGLVPEKAIADTEHETGYIDETMYESSVSLNSDFVPDEYNESDGEFEEAPFIVEPEAPTEEITEASTEEVSTEEVTEAPTEVPSEEPTEAETTSEEATIEHPVLPDRPDGPMPNIDEPGTMDVEDVIPLEEVTEDVTTEAGIEEHKQKPTVADIIATLAPGVNPADVVYTEDGMPYIMEGSVTSSEQHEVIQQELQSYLNGEMPADRMTTGTPPLQNAGVLTCHNNVSGLNGYIKYKKNGRSILSPQWMSVEFTDGTTQVYCVEEGSIAVKDDEVKYEGTDRKITDNQKTRIVRFMALYEKEADCNLMLSGTPTFDQWKHSFTAQLCIWHMLGQMSQADLVENLTTTTYNGRTLGTKDIVDRVFEKVRTYNDVCAFGKKFGKDQLNNPATYKTIDKKYVWQLVPKKEASTIAGQEPQVVSYWRQLGDANKMMKTDMDLNSLKAYYNGTCIYDATDKDHAKLKIYKAKDNGEEVENSEAYNNLRIEITKDQMNAITGGGQMTYPIILTMRKKSECNRSCTFYYLNNYGQKAGEEGHQDFATFGNSTDDPIYFKVGFQIRLANNNVSRPFELQLMKTDTYTKEGLKNTYWDLYAMEDIYKEEADFSRTLVYKAGSKIAENVRSNNVEDGRVYIKTAKDVNGNQAKLYAGSYMIAEVKTDANHYLSKQNTYPITVSEHDLDEYKESPVPIYDVNKGGLTGDPVNQSTVTSGATKPITNAPKKARLHIQKVDKDYGYSLAGINFELYAEENIYYPGHKNDSSKIVYPEGSLVASRTTKADGTITITKGKMSVATNGSNRDFIELLKQNNNGQDGFQLLPGKYRLKERKNPYYDSNFEQVVTLVEDQETVVPYGAITQLPIETDQNIVIVENKLVNYQVEVAKTDAETGNALADVTFELYADEDIQHPCSVYGTLFKKDSLLATKTSTGTKKATFTEGKIDKDAQIKQYVNIEKHKLVPGKYRIKEKVARNGYAKLTSEVKFEIKKGDGTKPTRVTTVPMTNQAVAVEISFTKVDAIVPANQRGDATLEGAVYGLYARTDIMHVDGSDTLVYAKDTEIARATTDAEGKATFSQKVPFGAYYVKEITPSLRKDWENFQGEEQYAYALDETEYDIDASYGNEDDITAVEIKKHTTVTETPLLSKFKILKVKSTKDGETPLQGIGFSVYLLSKMEELMELPKDEQGKYDFTKLTEADWEQLEEARQPIGEQGAKEIFTDENGYAVMSDEDAYKLYAGTYIIRESTYPAEDVIPLEPIRVTLPKYDENGTMLTEVPITAVNHVIKKLEITKEDITTGKELPGASMKVTDEQGNVVDEWISDTTAHKISLQESGVYTLTEVLAPETYAVAEAITFTVDDTDIPQKVVMKDELAAVAIEKIDSKTKKNLVGAEFTLYHKDGTIVEAKKTNEQGYVEFAGLPFGSYYIMETAAPEGYYLSAKKVEFDITASYTNLPPFVLENEKSNSSVAINKIDADTLEVLEGAVFGLFDANTEEKLAEAVSDAKGYAEFTNIGKGKFYLQEIDAPDGYVLSDKKVEIDTTQANYINAEPIIMKNKRANSSVAITKIDSVSKQPLKGAVFGLFAADSDRKLAEAISDEKGYAEFKDIAPGTYYLKEVAAPEGYMISNKKVPIDTTKTNYVNAEPIIMKNTPISKTGVTAFFNATPLIWMLRALAIVIAAFITYLIFSEKKGKRLTNQ